MSNFIKHCILVNIFHTLTYGINKPMIWELLMNLQGYSSIFIEVSSNTMYLLMLLTLDKMAEVEELQP